MDSTVFVAVLAAAVMHGSWNVLVKQKLDRFLSLCLIQLFMGLMGAAMLAAFGPPSASSVPYALCSGLLHFGYNLFLVRSYRTGDLSQVYPIARGTAPLLTLVTAWFVTREWPSVAGMSGIAVLVSGLWFIGLAGQRNLRLDGITLFFALGTSVFIAAYSIVDGLGGRVSGNAPGYAGLLFAFDGVMLLTAALASRGTVILTQMRPHWPSGLLGAALSAGAYWIVIWAMTQAPIAAVAALRESSILFVVLLSRRLLKETITLPRLAGAGLILLGAILIRMS